MTRGQYEGHAGALIPLLIPSSGHALLGRMFQATGAGPFPTIVLLHGFPGTESNFDLAHALRRSGRNVMTFHYRGSWGSPGRFTFAHALQDTRAALSYTRALASEGQHRMDGRCVTLMGHSMGGFAALVVAAENPDVAAAASLAGFDVGAQASVLAGAPEQRASWRTMFEESLPPLAGANADALLEELMEHECDWALKRVVPGLRGRPVLMVAGKADTVADPAVHHHPLAEAFRRGGHDRLETVVMPTDHGFIDYRDDLARTIESWLTDVERRRAVASTPPSELPT